MTDDEYYDPYADEYEESMEIVVETLTGTTFEMTVNSDDKVLAIKNKIHRVEGIPISQQNLLYRMKELNNDDRLCDLGITAGSTLRLVLSMRGGPISTRRLASSDHHIPWREIKEYVDSAREDIIEKLPPGSKVTVLLFREGDNFNLIRVIENEDGTCYPYSDFPSSRTTTTTRENNTQSKFRERTSENNVMMNKVFELRKKMEGLSMHKRIRKPEMESRDREDILNQPSTSRLDDSLDLLEDVESTSSTNRFFGRSMPDLCSDQFLLVDQRRNSRAGRSSHRPHRLDFLPKSEEIPLSSRNCTGIPPSIAILEEEPEPTLEKKDSDFSPPSPISVPSGDANTATMSQIPSLPSSSGHLLHLRHTYMNLKEHTDRPKTSPDKFDPNAQEFCNVVFNDAAERSHNVNSFKVGGNRRQSLDYSKHASNVPRMQLTSTSNPRIDSMESLNNRYGNSNLLSSQYASSSKLNSLEGVLGKHVTTEYNSERRSPFSVRRQIMDRFRNNLGTCSTGYSNLGYIANIEKIQNDAVPITKTRRSMNHVSNLESRNTDPTYELRPFKQPRRRCASNDQQGGSSNSNQSTSQQHSRGMNSQYSNSQASSTATNSSVVRQSSQQTSLPPIVHKKPARTRCAFCNKRLNITTIHTCRCGGIFCSQHRYSEVHGCQYDYKTEGRKILEQANPLVAAPKLPKI